MHIRNRPHSLKHATLGMTLTHARLATLTLRTLAETCDLKHDSRSSAQPSKSRSCPWNSWNCPDTLGAANGTPEIVSVTALEVLELKLELRSCPWYSWNCPWNCQNCPWRARLEFLELPLELLELALKHRLELLLELLELPLELLELLELPLEPHV